MNSYSFVLSLSFLTQIISQSKANTPLDGSYFTRLEYHKLDGSVIQKIYVDNLLACSCKCDRLDECLSLNFAALPNKRGLYDCELLRNDASGSPVLLKPSQDYHHFSRFVDKCATHRCLNGGTCETGYNEFKCHCPKGFMGEICEIKTYQWLKMNTSPVCFGAKGDAFGRFDIKNNGTVTQVKLVHLSGYVTCNVNMKVGKSNWGCALVPDKLNTIITNANNKIILPKNETFTILDSLEYTLPCCTSTGLELLFDNFTLDVTAGQEYRIWYGQDLNNHYEDDNGGQSCADVFIYELLD